ncbi:hypothetical protein GIB67_024995 [Kingdonia uniflora]|uniref:Uncharacterized protein n=1 Tax=Kingdonia uniflora TaxID=39325 RepID=A0A7J7N7C2_9MAGN|nr:hypothetical protein GIB67_024995 [Kingdonia uniflora]
MCGYNLVVSLGFSVMGDKCCFQVFFDCIRLNYNIYSIHFFVKLPGSVLIILYFS